MDLSSHRAWLTDEAGHVTYGPVAARGGESSGPTPVGTFPVLSKARHFYSTEFDAPMPYSVSSTPATRSTPTTPRPPPTGAST